MTTPTPTPQPSNPLLLAQGLPRFDLIQPEHVEGAVDHVTRHGLAQLEELESTLGRTQPGVDWLFASLDALDLPFERAWLPVQHLLSVRNTEPLRQAHDRALPRVVEFGLRVAQSRPVYEALKAIQTSRGFASLDGARRRAIELRVRDAEHAGVGLTGQARDRFNAIATEVSQLGSDFANHVLDSIKRYELILTDPADTAGWPSTLRRQAAQSYERERAARTDGAPPLPPGPPATPEAGPWRITLDEPSRTPFLQHSRRRDQREAVYRAFITRAAGGPLDNAPLIDRMLRLRREQARLLSFESYAQLSLAAKMAPSIEAVDRMHSELLRAARPHALADLEDLRRLAGESGQSEPLALWDLAFYAERLRERRFDFTDEQMRPYFPLTHVLSGVFELCERLLGVRITPAAQPVPRWHEDVAYFEVRDEGDRPIAGVYLDPYSRPGEKRGGAWMAGCLQRRVVAGALQNPVVHLVCNGTPPVGDPAAGGTPSLMSFAEVETLLHEMGHGLQAILTTQTVPGVTGLDGIEWDAVEIASQFMENWLDHRPTVRALSRHHQTGEPLPDALFDKLHAARTFRSGSVLLRQVQFGMVDLELHHRLDPEAPGAPDAFSVDRRIALESAVIPPLPEDRFLCSFTHIFAGGYAAGYYSYKWSEVLSADVFSAFEEAGLDDETAMRRLGRHYRDTFLALGGAMHPMDVFRAFRGREPSTRALLRHTGLLDQPVAV